MSGRRLVGAEAVPSKSGLPESTLETNPNRVRSLFARVKDFCEEKREHSGMLKTARDAIHATYKGFSPKQRVEFFAMLYDMFAERYDGHMSRTGHYGAIFRVMEYGKRFMREPVLDLTAGTCEPLRFALGLMESEGDSGTSQKRIICANEISPLMRGIGERKLSGSGAVFSSFNAFAPPKEMREKFATVLCSQTFHLISNKDKPRLVRAIKNSLVPGGFAMVIEEDPFRITQTDEIEAVSLFLRSVVAPMKHRGFLDALFENGGFTMLRDRAVADIDGEHEMRLHIFRKN